MDPVLVSAVELKETLASGGLRVVDCRHDLARADEGRRLYEEGHIPGAVFAHLDRDLSAARNGRNGRHPLPDREVFAQVLGQWGIAAGTRVVAYDQGDSIFAARLWWMLRWMGHERVSVLDGGWRAWRAVEGPISTVVEAPPAAQFAVGTPLERTLSAEAVGALLGEAHALLIDARAPDRFEGRNETIDPVAGHIPGATNRPWQCNLDEDGAFKSKPELRAELRALLASADASDVVLYCGSGVSACHNALALHIAGIDGARLYPGSWSEWISDPARPVETGR